MATELPEYEYIRRVDAVFALTNSETQAALKGMSGAYAYNEMLRILNGMLSKREGILSIKLRTISLKNLSAQKFSIVSARPILCPLILSRMMMYL